MTIKHNKVINMKEELKGWPFGPLGNIIKPFGPPGDPGGGGGVPV